MNDLDPEIVSPTMLNKWITNLVFLASACSIVLNFLPSTILNSWALFLFKCFIWKWTKIGNPVYLGFGKTWAERSQGEAAERRSKCTNRSWFPSLSGPGSIDRWIHPWILSRLYKENIKIHFDCTKQQQLERFFVEFIKSNSVCWYF